jgi:hypothetical protein
MEYVQKGVKQKVEWEDQGVIPHPLILARGRLNKHTTYIIFTGGKLPPLHHW